jgi:hypothetical protein
LEQPPQQVASGHLETVFELGMLELTCLGAVAPAHHLIEASP